MQSTVPRRQVVLVGAGHAHIQVLRRQLMRPLPDADVTVVVDHPVATYSGMVPGVVSGQYAPHEVEIDARPLAKRSGARFIVSRVTDIDPIAQRIHLTGRPPLAYDIASLNVGSTVGGLDIPGVRAHAIPTRPIAQLLDRLGARLRAGPERVVVVGAGAGGIELAFCTLACLRAQGRSPTVTLLCSGAHPLTDRAAPVGQAVLDAAAQRGLVVRTHSRATSVHADHVTLADGTALPADLVFWVTGAAAHAWVRASGLPTDPAGFIQVNDDLRVVGQDTLFAVGDCAMMTRSPLPRAGVYAVRQGPVLADNLQSLLTDAPLRPYRPQRDFLTLLNLGDGHAIGARWGRAITGTAMWHLKDRIDRRFMARFRTLDPEGERLAAFSVGMPSMAEMEMVCGGCAAKVGQTPLQQALSRLPPPPSDDAVVMGAGHAEDVVAFRHRGGTVVGNLDAFMAFTDDPWLVGRVGALNAVSDLIAKGTRPRFAMAAVTIPRDVPQEETLFQVLSGVRAALDPLGAVLLGGHTMLGEALSVGLHVTGFAEGPLWAQADLRPGDVLILTRPLGTGVLWNADMTGDAMGSWMVAVEREMIRGNATAMMAVRPLPVRGATDVTGFGLAGHVAELARACGHSARLWLEALPAYPGALALLRAGRRSTAHDENARVLRVMTAPAALATDPRWPLLFDPQTAGGLLLGLPADARADALDALREQQIDACVVGRIEPAREDGALIVVTRSPEP